ncbi:MAG: Crp/Fnr family transcriptional regulator [Chloroflexi bacterium]|nr:Crp/Fnr family transcriptional regulator [Chloroflexota bacterium]
MSPRPIALSITPDVYEIVGRCALFQGLETAVCQTITHAGHIYEMHQGEILLYQGEPAETFYIVLEGHVKLLQTTAEGHQIAVSYVGQGGGIGIIVALSHSEYPVTAEVVQDGRLIAWGQQTIQELMLQHPRLAVNGLRMLANYFVGLQKQLQELTTERVERRVARALLRLVRQTGRKVPEGILIDVPLSRQDLAEMTGTTLFTVSRILKGWEQNGIVLPERERVTVRLPHQLVLIAEDLPQEDKG